MQSLPRLSAVRAKEEHEKLQTQLYQRRQAARNREKTAEQKEAFGTLAAYAKQRADQNKKKIRDGTIDKVQKLTVKSGTQFGVVPKSDVYNTLAKGKLDKGVLDKIKNNKPLTVNDLAQMKNALGMSDSLRFLSGKGLNSLNLGIFTKGIAKDVAFILAGIGNLLNSGAITGGGSGFPQGYVISGCGIACGGGDFLPVEYPSVFFPNDPASFAQTMEGDGEVDPGVYYAPPGPGIAIAITPNLPVDYDGGGSRVDGSGSADGTFQSESPVAALGETAVDDPQGRFSTRFLRVGNDTAVRVDIFLQYKTQTDQGEVWLPAKPAVSLQAVTVSLAPGEIADIKEGDWRLNASRVRIWAKSETQEWNQFKNRDLPLVPEAGALYASNDLQVFNFTIR